MTFTLNGVGTRISGGRALSDTELRKWSSKLPQTPEFRGVTYYIGTESLVFIYFPVIPLKSYVYCYVQSKWYESSKYLQLFNPAGKGVYWPHVKGSWSFYVWPAIFIFLLASFIFRL